MDTRPIGVFDSGLGGLTFVKELERQLPHEHIVYFGDTGRVPYGTRGREIIKKYAKQDIRFLKSFGIKAAVIACGTVSSVAFGEVEEAADFPVVGVVEPASAAAAAASKSGNIGVIATSATISSGSYQKELLKLAPKANITTKACPLLVPLVENGYFARDSKIASLAVHDYLDELREKVDTLILGCTHYPLLRGVIADVLPGVELIDAGLETAKSVAGILEKDGLLSDDGGGSRFFVSDCTDDFARLAGIFLERSLDRVEKVDIEKY